MIIIDKLNVEMKKSSDSLILALGVHLIPRLMSDEVLRIKAAEQDLTMKEIESYVIAEAKKRAGNKSQIAIPASEIFNLMIHGIDENLIKKTKVVSDDDQDDFEEDEYSYNKKVTAKKVDKFDDGLFAFAEEDF
jgi:hypothetical protein